MIAPGSKRLAASVTTGTGWCHEWNGTGDAARSEDDPESDSGAAHDPIDGDSPTADHGSAGPHRAGDAEKEEGRRRGTEARRGRDEEAPRREVVRLPLPRLHAGRRGPDLPRAGAAGALGGSAAHGAEARPAGHRRPRPARVPAAA